MSHTFTRERLDLVAVFEGGGNFQANRIGRKGEDHPKRNPTISSMAVLLLFGSEKASAHGLVPFSSTFLMVLAPLVSNNA